MNEQISEAFENDFLQEEAGFVQTLAQYYSDFLATDFKKGRLPKRRFQIRDSKGRRSGIPLDKFLTFETIVKKHLSEKFDRRREISFKLGIHKARLPAVIAKAIEPSIEKLDLSVLSDSNDKITTKFKEKIVKEGIDLEMELDLFLGELRRNASLEISAPIIQFLEPVFEKSSTNLKDVLVNLEDEIADLFLNPIEQTLPSAIAMFLQDKKDEKILLEIEEVFRDKNVQMRLSEYFNNFSASDLFTELRELVAVEQLEDNLEFYLYVGDIKLQSSTFPIFYIPLKVSLESETASIKLESRVLVNKKVVDYVSLLIQEEIKTKRASPVTDRILYLEQDASVYEEIGNVFQDILLAFEFDENLLLQSHRMMLKKTLKNCNVSVSNSIYLALFDKSDESMLTDYEELVHSLRDGSGLMSFLEELVNGFLESNPRNIIDTIDDEWDETDIPERLVFATPLPLAEEQRKIIAALENRDSKFVTVEGPPGTGKSHTISAIAFGAILKGQSILILSDKKEALDVVENKLNDTLGKVRPSDDFVNPILRLGRASSNFTKLITTKSIEKLRTQNREIRKNKDTRKEEYEKVVAILKKDIANQIDVSKNIDVVDVFNHERRFQEFLTEYSAFDGLDDMFTLEPDEKEGVQNINKLLKIRDKSNGLSQEFVEFMRDIGKDKIYVSEGLSFIKTVKAAANDNKIFAKLPKLNQENIFLLDKFISDLTLAKMIILGYLFVGKKIKAITSELEGHLGYQTLGNHPKIIIAELKELKIAAVNFYNKLRDQTGRSESYIDRAIALNLGINLSVSYLKDITEIEKLIDKELIPLLGDDESLLEILTLEESVEINFYQEFISIFEEKQKLAEGFKFEDYNYLARKTELENFNALELASEIDTRVIKFATENKNDAKTLNQIIRQKKKFPKEQFGLLRSAFPCMISSLRDYAEYIPLEKELFDIIIIDEASQVSIAQAFPALIRAKKVIVLGDKRQFGNVKTANASKEQNTTYFARVRKALEEEKGKSIDVFLEERLNALNITNSVMDFMEGVSNYTVMLKKHFRGYPEMISFSSKYFYSNALQPMKIRGKLISEVLEFVQLDGGKFIELYQNTNDNEADYIISRMIEQLENEDYRSVAVITPFTKQQEWISRKVADHPRYRDFIDKLKFRSFTFDSCQGEERDIIYYSFVATEEQDKLWSIFPTSLYKQLEEELDKSKKMQRLNVGFSRGKEKLVFVHSKPIEKMKSSLREVLNHYSHKLENATQKPKDEELDVKSPAEKRLRDWLMATPVVSEYQPEIIPQFSMGDHLKSLDSGYSHPSYRVDFLLRFQVNGKQRDIILEYDGFEFHFEKFDEIDAGNWKHYLTPRDVEREKVLESYGYKTLRVNKFNIGNDPVQTLSDRIQVLLDAFAESGDALIKKVLDNTTVAHEGLKKGSVRHCKKCDQHKPFEDFKDPNTKRGFRTYCSNCTKSQTLKRKKLSFRKGSLRRKRYL